MQRSRISSSISRGFTLVEVLVTVVIFSVGLLGLAGLQATGIKLNHSSLIRSQATLLAYDVVDCMRANKANIASYSRPDKNAAKYSTPSTIAESDINNWLDNLSNGLPSGKGSITLNGNRATVIVEWDEARTPGVPVNTMTVVSDI